MANDEVIIFDPGEGTVRTNIDNIPADFEAAEINNLSSP